ncbi:MAG: tRNA(fMet)-specific endonuclease VapC [Candidatus Poribacteria bacterium]|nr:tRNA(fMet)-specific endonuclease VapC [Candidatus Poribacteria bacterium]
MYLLDTTHCIKSMSGNYEIDYKLANMPDVQIATCLIVRGELMFGAYKSDQFSENLRRLESFFAEIPIYGMDIETTDIYGKLKAYIIEHFGPKDKSKRRNTKAESLGFKDNDLRIASIAIQHDMILVSADIHIQKLQGIIGLRVESW